MCKLYDLRYCHYKNSHGSSSIDASSSSVDPLGSMWDTEEESGCDTNDFDHYNVNRMLFSPNEKKNFDVLGWGKSNSRTFPTLSVYFRI